LESGDKTGKGRVERLASILEKEGLLESVPGRGGR
jgi:DNA-binding IscR family transcriptional regulator